MPLQIVCKKSQICSDLTNEKRKKIKDEKNKPNEYTDRKRNKQTSQTNASIKKLIKTTN